MLIYSKHTLRHRRELASAQALKWSRIYLNRNRKNLSDGKTKRRSNVSSVAIFCCCCLVFVSVWLYNMLEASDEKLSVKVKYQSLKKHLSINPEFVALPSGLFKSLFIIHIMLEMIKQANNPHFVCFLSSEEFPQSEEKYDKNFLSNLFHCEFVSLCLIPCGFKCSPHLTLKLPRT